MARNIDNKMLAAYNKNVHRPATVPICILFGVQGYFEIILSIN